MLHGLAGGFEACDRPVGSLKGLSSRGDDVIQFTDGDTLSDRARRWSGSLDVGELDPHPAGGQRLEVSDAAKRPWGVLLKRLVPPHQCRRARRSHPDIGLHAPGPSPADNPALALVTALYIGCGRQTGIFGLFAFPTERLARD